jgi:AraC-like DNA-binding protein
MAVLLDTSQLPPELRANAVAEVIEFSGAPTRIEHTGPEDEAWALMEYFTMGDAHVLKSKNSPQRFITTPALLKDAESDLITVSLRLAGTATHTRAPGRLLGPGDLFTTQLWLPYEYYDNSGSVAAFHTPLDRLGLSRQYVTRACALIHANPLAPQLQRHLQLLFRDVDVISQGPAASMVAEATIDLVRAALVAALEEEPGRHEGWQESLGTAIKSYIAQHLADPNLGAERIAKAMFISVRQLYKYWEAEHCPLGQWIIERRLEAARHDLTSPRGQHQTISSIAGRWGFADATHFSRRFRQSYGMSPREWRRMSRNSANRGSLSGPGREDLCTRSR